MEGSGGKWREVEGREEWDWYGGRVRERKGKEGRRHTSRNALDAATARETSDGRLGYALDVVAEDLAVTFGAAFAEAFAAFSAFYWWWVSGLVFALM